MAWICTALLPPWLLTKAANSKVHQNPGRSQRLHEGRRNDFPKSQGNWDGMSWKNPWIRSGSNRFEVCCVDMKGMISFAYNLSSYLSIYEQYIYATHACAVCAGCHLIQDLLCSSTSSKLWGCRCLIATQLQIEHPKINQC